VAVRAGRTDHRRAIIGRLNNYDARARGRGAQVAMPSSHAPLHRALRLKSAETDASMSDLVNAAIRHSIAEDADDFAAFPDRMWSRGAACGTAQYFHYDRIPCPD
jgi:hypothetical protein